ncbi:M15 family metallopeptidase [Flammeovirga yaeyamensis]|uniref:M15 family metallopeptidase n=1 Tax=Flammeovirga yaeyamensis TaxID=367791 RepID=A0AAX1NF83_9BACT|nr:M15 family metallopeptidase [Flammeovirga yaeyamensis]MBB3699898.1 hypothetical protein [Flammeovirga yaeyamensis]NMF38306.1 M15 family metallopeptidase [Flammeovirga yaeyamensis]QWG04718.1 M15 family metallopeptidase [Flammeovirga yaeyamensis]
MVLFILGTVTIGILGTSYLFYPKQTRAFLLPKIALVAEIVFKTTPYEGTTKGIDPKLDVKIKAVLAQLHKEGINAKVISGYRSLEKQKDIYAQGRTKAGGIISNAIPGLSFHNYGWAVDIAVYENGKPNWNTKHWDRIGEVGKQHGLVWGGEFRSIVDKPHLQLSLSDIFF